ncbi:MAG: TIGR00645 family protein [Planctomycetota bacterium]|nr:TIGR00645 family protein [Planctomycetota bacterium]MCX8040016.1 TIGR00645 family protein [Planctomycetota bacterium]MDW8372612.1 TIGR00645 family protein [Planctomycetota bacterium]
MLRRVEQGIEWAVFAARWLLAPVYLGLIAGQIFFSITFFEGLWHLIHGVTTGTDGARFTEREAITAVLTLLDMIMVANLVIMVLIGGYATFVSRLAIEQEEDRPDWLDHIDPGTLKTKLAGALVSISGIHLLQTFNDLSKPGYQLDSAKIAWQLGIHVAFIATTVLLAWADLVFERKVKAARENERDRQHG